MAENRVGMHCPAGGRDYAAAHAIRVDFEADPHDFAGLAPPMETAIFRIVQEAFTNIARHASAASARILVDRLPEALQVLIVDDGRGFDVRAMLGTPAAHHGMGLHSMRERATLLRGTLAIESSPGRGVTIILKLPLA